MVYDVEVTPNRPDLNSVIGIAREIAAVTGNPLRIPELKIQNAKCKIEKVILHFQFLGYAVDCQISHLFGITGDIAFDNFAIEFGIVFKYDPAI